MKHISHILTIFSILFSGCNSFEYHPYTADVKGKINLNSVYSEALEYSDIKPPFKFAFITDTQGSMNETRGAIETITSRGDISFIVHGGDVTDFGLAKEYVWCRDIMEKAGIPYLTVIGNHDCLGNGINTFRHIFGPLNFSLNVGPLHILCLNTNALEYDYSNPVPDFDFIEKDLAAVNLLNKAKPGSITHTVAIMHARPYDEQFNNNVAKYFNRLLEEYPGMSVKDVDNNVLRGFCVNGHNHHLEITDIFKNGILYYQCPNMADKTFFVFTITETGYEYETVRY